MRKLPQRMLTVLAAMFLWVPALPTALAEVRTVGAPDNAKPWLHWGVTIIIVGACGAIMFMNAKRSHQS